MTQETADIRECIGNPLKLRIVMLLSRNGPMTAKTILEETGAPQTSLYRALGSMVDGGILRVVQETRVRAVTERTYGLAIDMEHFDPASSEANDVGGYCGLFSAFCLGLIRDFQEYAEAPDADLRRDVTGFASLGLYLTDDQARDLVRRMAGLMREYTVRTSEDQSLHTMACVLSPPRDGGRTAERRVGTIPVEGGPEL